MSGVELVVGGLTGLHAATWGAYKDSPFEGFHRRSFLRSLVLGVMVGLALGAVAGDIPLLLLVGLVYAGERLITEGWKVFLREDSQAAYAIPMRLAVGGRPIDARFKRYACGLGVVAAMLLLGWWLPGMAPEREQVVLTVFVGGLGGWLTAVGGAWKDAPVEGFSGWKFMRSPVVATAWAGILASSTRDWLLLPVAAGGLSVLVIETYKTFLTGGRPPGKFAGMPTPWAVASVRARCRAAHCLVYGGLAGVVTGTVAVVVPAVAGVAIAMLITAHRTVSLTATREPDADAELRRESA